MRRLLGAVLGGTLLVVLVWVGSSHHKPGHDKPPWSTTTTVATTTTTVATTTTTAPTTTTTTTPAVLDLTENLVIDATTHTFAGTINANGYEILVQNGGSLNWDGVTVNNAARIMFHMCAAPSTIRNTVIDNSGVATDVVDNGFYPLHWHLEGDCSRGSLVENVTITNSVRAFVPHGSNGITFRNVATSNIRGEAFWWDQPGTNPQLDPDPNCAGYRPACTIDNSDDIVLDGATFTDSYWDRTFPPECCSRWHRLSTVVLHSGVGNVIRNVDVVGIVGGANCAGFHWGESDNHNVENVGWLFEFNTANDDNCHGIGVWQNDAHTHLISDFVGAGVDHGAYVTPGYHYERITVPYFVGHALGWSVNDSALGVFTARDHTLPGDPVVFTNTTFTAFVVDDGNLSPGIYQLSNTNLTCADINWLDPHPDSQVFIDGIECNA